jgi:tRNA (guanine37-N1)-methyltransferase
MKLDLITIFPELFGPFFEKGMVGQAVKNGLVNVHITNPRTFALDKHKSVDDRPYGGGDGMVMLPEVMAKAVESIPLEGRPVVLLSPQGERLTDKMAREFSRSEGLVLVCARYGGVDERFIRAHVDREVSVGDYILCGGEVASMCLIESTLRFIPGVLGNVESAEQDSFSNGLLEAPLYTRPEVFRGMTVPSVLLGGHHQQIKDWRARVGLLRTHFRRPDLVNPGQKEDLKQALAWFEGLSAEEKNVINLDV